MTPPSASARRLQFFARERAAAHRTRQVDRQHLARTRQASCSASRRMTPAQLTSTSSRGRSSISARTARSSRTSSAIASRAAKSGLARARRRLRSRVAPVTVTTAPASASAAGDGGADAARPADDERDLPGEHVVAKRRGDGAHHGSRRAPSSRSTSAMRGSGATAPIAGRRQRRRGVGIARGGKQRSSPATMRATNAPSKQSPAPVASTASTRWPGRCVRGAVRRRRGNRRGRASARRPRAPSSWHASTMRVGSSNAEQELRIVEARQRPIGDPQTFRR